MRTCAISIDPRLLKLVFDPWFVNGKRSKQSTFDKFVLGIITKFNAFEIGLLIDDVI